MTICKIRGIGMEEHPIEVVVRWHRTDEALPWLDENGLMDGGAVFVSGAVVYVGNYTKQGEWIEYNNPTPITGVEWWTYQHDIISDEMTRRSR